MPIRLVITDELMQGFFGPGLENIVLKAKAMLERAGNVEVILLVGGFSGSSYAVRWLRSLLETPRTCVIAPTYGPIAVLEGGWTPKRLARKCSVITHATCLSLTSHMFPLQFQMISNGSSSSHGRVDPR